MRSLLKLLILSLLLSALLVTVSAQNTDNASDDTQDRMPNRSSFTRATDFDAVRQQVQTRVNAVAVAKTDFETARRQLRTTSVDREQFERNVAARAKVLLQTRAEALREKVDELRARGIEINAETAAQVFTEIEVDVTNAATSDELISQSNRIRVAWQAVLHTAVLKHAQSLNTRFETLLEKGKTMADRLETAVAALREQGRDTTELDAGLARLQADLDELSRVHAELRAEFSAATSEQERARVLYKARRVLAVSRERLQRDMVFLRRLIALYRAQLTADTTDDAPALEAVSTVSAQVQTQQSLDAIVAEIDTEAVIHAQSEVVVDNLPAAEDLEGDAQ